MKLIIKKYREERINCVYLLLKNLQKVYVVLRDFEVGIKKNLVGTHGRLN